jgi:hypothetical protein
MMNDDIVVVRHVVATLQSATWHLVSSSSFRGLTWPVLIRSVTWRCHVICGGLVGGGGCGRTRPQVDGGDAVAVAMTQRW